MNGHFLGVKKMFLSRDGFKEKNFIVNIRKLDKLIAKINHRNDAKKMKRPINCAFDDKHTSSPLHGGLSHPSLAINT